MKLSDYLNGMRASTTAEELEAAIQANFKHSFRGRTWSQICKVRETCGDAICRAHPNGRYVPYFGAGRKLTVCEEVYRVGRGGNSTGVRYAWYDAKMWAVDVLKRNGLSQRAAHSIWDNWSSYPHRCLTTVEEALAGGLSDPQLDTLIQHERTDYGKPINYTVERNEADEWDYRASLPCSCGGTLFDWGAGHSDGFDFINWHCNACPDVFTEYLSPGRILEIRNVRRAALKQESK